MCFDCWILKCLFLLMWPVQSMYCVLLIKLYPAPGISLWISWNSHQIPAMAFIEIQKPTLKFMWNVSGPQMIRTVLMNKAGGLICPHFKTCAKLVIKTGRTGAGAQRQSPWLAWAWAWVPPHVTLKPSREVLCKQPQRLLGCNRKPRNKLICA